MEAVPFEIRISLKLPGKQGQHPNSSLYIVFLAFSRASTPARCLLCVERETSLGSSGINMSRDRYFGPCGVHLETSFVGYPPMGVKKMPRKIKGVLG